MTSRFLTILTGRNLPKIRQPRKPEPSIIGIMRALNRSVVRVFDRDRKDHHWGKRKLKRNQ